MVKREREGGRGGKEWGWESEGEKKKVEERMERGRE